MKFVLERGAAFLAPSGPADMKHLHVVLTNECEDGLHLVAVVSSIKPKIKYDTTCVLQPGDHGFLDKPSFVLYGKLTQMLAVHITKMIDQKFYVEKDPVTGEVCDRICEGVLDSDFTTNGMRRYYEDNGDL